MQFDGTLLVVSHDRAFLDNVVTSILVFDEDYGLVEIVGGYQDYLNWRVKQAPDRKSTRLNSSHTVISYAVFCLKKKTKKKTKKIIRKSS